MVSSLDYSNFLKKLDSVRTKSFWVKIQVLTKEEIPIRSIEGRVLSGSVTIAGSSSLRRTCTLSYSALESENDLTDVDNLLSLNKKVDVRIGIKNDIDDRYDDVIWFPLGIFVIHQASISHNTSDCTISLTCQDKMCLLNGECGGSLPASITFHEYDQIIGERICTTRPELLPEEEINNYTIYSYNGTYKSWTKEGGWVDANKDLIGTVAQVPQRVYDIIQTLVCNYGEENLNKVIIEDVPLEIKQIVRYTGSDKLYLNTKTGRYTLSPGSVIEDQEGEWRAFGYNEDVGYQYTDFTYPGELISNVGDSVTSVLDAIASTLGNFEYFYDVEGNFVFREVRNYLNNSYDPTTTYRLDNNRKVEIDKNNLYLLDQNSYQVGFEGNQKSVYTFEEGNALISSYANNPVYTNIKNDYHIWGKADDGLAIHYHVAIKNKPTGWENNSYNIIWVTDDKGDYTGGLRLAKEGESGVSYTPTDWRAYLYLSGLEKQSHQIRPDVYEQEILDFFDTIYDFKQKAFKSDIIKNPNNLKYFIDYLEPSNELFDYSIENIGARLISETQEDITRLYSTDVPNYIMIDMNVDSYTRQNLIRRCEREGQTYSNVTKDITAKIALGMSGYTAQDYCRSLLYQHTSYCESISISSIPIYYLDVNTRITVDDRKSGIHGDFIIDTINLPLDPSGQMTITASRALDRI